MKNKISIVLLAAGKAVRFKSNKLKQSSLLNKKKLIDYSRDYFRDNFKKSPITIVINKNISMKKFAYNEYSCLGSTTRLKSLYKALTFMKKNNILNEFILIHDVARPIINHSDVRLLIKSINNEYDGYSLGYPLTNALKYIDMNQNIYNVDRKNLWMTFTPQIFRTSTLLTSVDYVLKQGLEVDDDIESLLISLYKCKIIKSSPTNIKITYKDDLKYIKKLL